MGVFSTTSATYVDVTGMTLTTASFTRTKKVLILASCAMYGETATSGDYEGESFLEIDVDGASVGVMRQRNKIVSSERVADVATMSVFDFVSLGTGTHTIKLRMKATPIGVGNYKASGVQWKLGYLILGN